MQMSLGRDQVPEQKPAQESETGPRRWKRWLLVGVVAGTAAAVIVPLVLVMISWSRIDRIEFDPVAARDQLADIGTTSSVPEVDALPAGEPGDWTTMTMPVFTPVVPGTIGGPSTTTTTTEPYPPPPPVPPSTAVPDSDHQAILVIGSDRSIGGSRRADVIMLALIPADGSKLLLVSLPRDLYLPNPCGGGWARINGALNGCGSVSGPNLLAVVVEDYTGIPIDHFVMFDYDGFARVIDLAGGISVCVDYPTFDTNTTPDLDLPAGCSTLGGRMALAWVRSRKTRQIVDGVEQAVPGVGDYTRTARQRDVVSQMFGKLSGFSNPTEIVALANAAPGAFTLNSGLTLSGAVSIAWDLRGKAGSMRSPRIPVVQYTTPGGAWVIVPTEAFSETIG